MLPLTLLWQTYKNYVFIAIFLVVGGLVFYFYIDYNQLQAQLEISQQSIKALETGIRTEQETVKQLQKNNKEMIDNFKKLQISQQKVQKNNDLLRKKLQEYNYTEKALTDSSETEKELNKTFSDLLQQLQISSQRLLEIENKDKNGKENEKNQ